MGSKAIRRASDGVAEALRNIPGPVFAAAWLANSTDDTLIVHASATPNRSRLRNEILNAVRALGVTRARVRFHNAARLASPRSLEKLVSRFAGDQIVYDPTGAVSRAKALVAASHSVRAALCEKVLGLYYAPRLRTFYVSLKAASVAVGDRVKVLDLAKIELAVKSSIAGAFASKIEECPAIRIGFGYPEASLVPVDQMSVVSFGTRMTTFVARRWKSVTLAALVGLGFGTPALARDPAVSEANLKITGQGGSIDDNDAWTGAGVFTAPLGETGGIALEGGASGVDGDRTIGAAGHLFIRDPDSYLLGVFGAYASEDDFNLEVVRVGAEAELYLNQISILASAGYQFSDIGHALVPVEDTAFGSIDLRWYATNNLALTVGGVFDEQRSIGTASVEWQPGFSALPGLAFNVNGEIGEDDYDSVMGGITYYFGSTASLKDRHRKQDPESALLNLFQSVEQERSRIAAIYGNPN